MANKQFGFVFPGQGSQTVGMLADIAAQFGEVKQTFAQASAILGYDLWQLVQNGPPAELDKTFHTQPALLVASYSIWQIIQARRPLKPAVLAGHSLGEYTALVCANSLSFADAVKLVSARSHYMQDAVAPGSGAMAAIIGLDEATLLAICKEAVLSSEEVLSIANYNSIGQIVIAGHKAPVERAIRIAKEKGAKLAVILPVSVPSHCSLMKPAAEHLAIVLKTTAFQTPEIPILNNADVNYYTSPESIRDGLIRQLYLPVRWVETVEKIVGSGIKDIVECGPGKVLTGLNKRIDKELQLQTTCDLSSLNAFLSENGEKQKTA